MVKLNFSDNWKKLFFALSILILIIMPFVSSDYGQSGDEWLQAEFGEDVYKYFTQGDKQALDYNNKSLQYHGLEYYGGIFDYTMAALHHALPSIPILTLRHFFNALVGAVMMIFIGLMTFRISKKWRIAFLALLFVFFTPRLFGESMNNPKDIPFACGFVITMYGLLAFLQDFPARRWKHIAILGIGFALSFGVRPAGGLLLVAYIGMFSLLYFLLDKQFKETVTANGNKLMIRGILQIVAALAFGYIVGLLCWPWGLQKPLSNPIVALQKMTNLEIQLRVLFEGVYRMNFEMPWYYEFKWIFISNPIIILLGAVLFLLLFLRARKLYGWFAVIFVVFCALFPILYMIYKHSSVYDTWRHVFFVYTFWIVAAALGYDVLCSFIREEKYRLIPLYIAILGLLPAMWWTVKSHPNQYVYFNEFIGGPSGAVGFYDIDYYQNSGKQAADWIRKNVKPVPGKKILVLSNMSGMDKYFAKDTAWIATLYGRYNERYHLDWDYYIAYPRYIPAEPLQNGLWPQGAVHVVEESGAPLSAIFLRKSKAGIAAYEAAEKKDYATAIQKYEEYLKADNTDENVYVNYGLALAYYGQIDAAIAALIKATELNPGAPEYFDLLAKLYQAKGDMANAQKAMGRVYELQSKTEE